MWGNLENAGVKVKVSWLIVFCADYENSLFFSQYLSARIEIRLDLQFPLQHSRGKRTRERVRN